MHSCSSARCCSWRIASSSRTRTRSESSSCRALSRASSPPSFGRRQGRAPEPAELSAAVEGMESATRSPTARKCVSVSTRTTRSFVSAWRTSCVRVESKLGAARQPSDAELDAWLVAHRERYDTPARYDFEHYFASKQAGDAEGRGAAHPRRSHRRPDPEDVGDAFSEGRQLDRT